MIGIDRATDIALLKVEREDLAPATLGDSILLLKVSSNGNEKFVAVPRKA